MLFNAESLAAAANAAGFNVTPEQLIARVPQGKQSVPREMTPQVRAQVGATLINDWGMPISAEGEFENFDFQRGDGDDRLPGRAQVIGKGAALASTADAGTEAAKNPDEAALAKAEATHKQVDHTIAQAGKESPPVVENAAPVATGEATAVSTAPAAKLELTPSDLAIVVTVNQALQSVGLPPRDDADGNLTVAEFKAKHAGTVAEAAAADAGTDPNAPAPPAPSTPADRSGQE
jgi:hypothetical protein